MHAPQTSGEGGGCGGNGGGGNEGGNSEEGGDQGGSNGGDEGGGSNGGDDGDGGDSGSGAEGGRNGGREGRGGEDGSQQPVQSQPRTSSSLHCSRPFRAPHVVARHPMSQLGVFSGIEGGCGGESGGTPGGEGSAEGGGGDGGGGDGEGGGGDGGLSGDGGGCVGGEGADGDCGGGGMSTTAKSIGSHCGGQELPRLDGCDIELGRPKLCAMIASAGKRVVADKKARERERTSLGEGNHTRCLWCSTTLAASGAPALPTVSTAVAEGGVRGDTGTNWRCWSTSFLPIAASSSAPAQLALGVAAASVSPQLHGRLASIITPPRVTLPSCALHCHAGSGCGGGSLTSDTIEAPTHGGAPSTSAAEQSRASSAG